MASGKKKWKYGINKKTGMVFHWNEYMEKESDPNIIPISETMAFERLGIKKGSEKGQPQK